MSVPVLHCLVAKAAKGDEEAYQELIRIMRINYTCGHWSHFPCSHEPECEASPEALGTLQKRVDEYFAQNPVKVLWEVDE